MATDGQYEGYAYLGLGILAMILVGLFAFIANHSTTAIKKLLKQYKIEAFSISMCIFLLYTIALGPLITFSNKTIAEVPYPIFILKLYGLFRSSGRFLWGVWNVITILALYLIWKNLKKNICIGALILCVILQSVDFFALTLEKHHQFTADRSAYVSSLTSESWNVLSNKKAIVLLNKQPLRLNTFYDLADKALKYNIGITDFYYSRRNAKEIDQYKERVRDEILSSKASASYIYIADTYNDILDFLPYLNFYYIDGLLVGSIEPIYGTTCITQVTPVQNNVTGSDHQIILKIIEAGTYGFEISGAQAANSFAFIDQAAITIYNKYDGDSLGMGTFEVDQTATLSIQYEGGDVSLNLYKLDTEFSNSIEKEVH